MNRGQLARLLPLAAALAAAAWFAQAWPRDQTIHYVLGDSAPLVEEVDARWRPEDRASATSGGTLGSRGGPSRERSGPDDWTREASFRYAPGQAPRIITHEPRLADGDYTVEIQIVAPGCGPSDPGRTRVVQRHVTLHGGVTSIGLAAPAERDSLAAACSPRAL